MKTSIVLATIMVLGACASAPDAPTKIEDCRKITDKNFRDLCIAEVLQEESQEGLFDETPDEESE